MMPVLTRFIGLLAQVVKLAIGWYEAKRIRNQYKDARKAAKRGDVDTLNDILR